MVPEGAMTLSLICLIKVKRSIVLSSAFPYDGYSTTRAFGRRIFCDIKSLIKRSNSSSET